MKKTNQNTMKNLFPYLILVVVIFAVLTVLSIGRNITHELTTGELMKEMQSKNVTELTITPSGEESVYYIGGKLSNYKDNEEFTATVIEAEMDNIVKYAESQNLKVYKTNPDPGSISWLYVIVNVVPLLVLVGATYFIFMKMANSNKGSMDFLKSQLIQQLLLFLL